MGIFKPKSESPKSTYSQLSNRKTHTELSIEAAKSAVELQKAEEWREASKQFVESVKEIQLALEVENYGETGTMILKKKMEQYVKKAEKLLSKCQTVDLASSPKEEKESKPSIEIRLKKLEAYLT